ncbi:MAG: hypothetical protein LBJ46_02830, partial [Planctomycetota bacterium]|nr:hypothetical protein [Planctomycetota bacterium]
MTDASGEHCFSFLAKAKPASLYKLLGKLDDGEAATVLAHLPPLLTAQAMAYYPEERQPGLLAGMRQARRADPERAVAVAEKIRAMLARLKAEAPRSSRSPGSLAPANDSGAPAPAPAPRPDRSPLSPRGVVASAYGKTPAKPPSSGQSDQPQPWKPRVTDATPINAPAKPGRPPAVAGPPSKSPLAKLNIFELLGFSKKDAETDKTPPGNRRAPPRDAAGKPAPARPPAREGTVASRKVRTADTPRVLGAGKAPAAPKRPERPNASRSGAAPGGRG